MAEKIEKKKKIVITSKMLKAACEEARELGLDTEHVSNYDAGIKSIIRAALNASSLS